MAEERDNLEENKASEEDLQKAEAGEEVKEEAKLDDTNKETESYDEIEDLKNSLLRLQADFSNFRKRSEKEKEDTIKFASEGLITALLPILDNFYRAFDAAQAQGVEGDWLEGFALIQKDLIQVLESKGLEEIEATGQAFDPEYHQAVLTEPSDGESGIVLETLQKGYKLRDKVIRPSIVKVSE